jgi:CRISPR/Cas system CSM-associated protein Csm2 small subunit
MDDIKNEEQLNYQAVLEELDKEILNPELIQDNKLYFTVGEDMYRVSMPNQQELTIAEEKRNVYKIELLQKSGTITESKLKKLLKEKQDIDIEEMQKEADDLEKRVIDLYLSLARKRDSEVEDIKKIKEHIQEYLNQRKTIVLEIAEHLSPSIQVQSKNRYMECLTFLCTEKCIKVEKVDTWEKSWKDFEDYQKDNSKVAMKAIGMLTHLMLNL